jgi:hypothetical protein
MQPYLKALIERDVIIRCTKHILNQKIRDCCSEELISSVVAHFFNCILAPNDFIKKMDDGTIKNHMSLMKDRTIENQD